MSCLLVEMPADTVVLARRIDETKTRMISISLMGSIVTGLGETYIKAFFRSLVRNKIKELIFTKF
jgi:4-hydroxy-3-methylbut-2-en-1-yl diphosphate synthase IspG/GcpE